MGYIARLSWKQTNMEEDLSSNDTESQSLESEEGKENTAVIYKPPSGINLKRTDTKLEAVTKCTRDKRISSPSTDSLTTNRPQSNATTFKASQLLDDSFSEWLAEKEKEKKCQQKVIKEFKLKQEEEASLKKVMTIQSVTIYILISMLSLTPLLLVQSYVFNLLFVIRHKILSGIFHS